MIKYHEKTKIGGSDHGIFNDRFGSFSAVGPIITNVRLWLVYVISCCQDVADSAINPTASAWLPDQAM